MPFHLSAVFKSRAATDACDTRSVNQDPNAGVAAGGFVCSLVLDLFPRGKALPWKIFISMLYGPVFVVPVKKKAFLMV